MVQIIQECWLNEGMKEKEEENHQSTDA